MKALQNYISGSVKELHKVTWLTNKQLINHTILVLVVTLTLSLFMTMFDGAFQYGFNYLITNFS